MLHLILAALLITAQMFWVLQARLVPFGTSA